ncbi:MAG: response regulator transcription factor [Sphingobacteriales bacterium]|nr:MAG: response regulator transcription factor [Sphingobacteriales bacterium]
MTKVLFAEDEAVLGKLVKEAMENKGFDVEWIKNGKETLASFKGNQFDICVLDVMMPGMDGFTLAKQVRALDETVPILFLTARSQTNDVLKGFESGGNDYIKKPFSLDELFVRIQELVKRNKKSNSNSASTQSEYQIGKYVFYPQTQSLIIGSEKIKLSHKEALLLHELAMHQNELMERRQTLIKIWGDDTFFNGRNMDVYIAKLRKHLAQDTSLSIMNIRGHGFKLIQE